MPRAISDDAVPDWVHLSIRTWGVAKRRLWLGGFKRDEHFHVDGFSRRSVLAKIKDERDGAASSRARQVWPEALTGDALEVQRALSGMPELPFYALHLLHVFDRDISVRDKAGWLGLSVPALYAAASRGRVWVHARLEADPAGIREIDLNEILRDLLAPPLRSATPERIRPAHTTESSLSCAVNPDFAPLERTILHLPGRRAG